MEDSRQSRQHGMPLLLHGRRVAADAAKGCGTSRTATGATAFCCPLAQRRSRSAWLFVKGSERSSSKASTCSARKSRASVPFLGLALFASPFAFFSRRARGWGLSGIASRQDLEIARDPVITLDRGNRGLAEQPPLVAGVMQIEQEVVHLGGPRLLFLLGHGSTISDQVGCTDAVRTVIGLIARQSIVHAATCKPWPDT